MVHSAAMDENLTPYDILALDAGAHWTSSYQKALAKAQHDLAKISANPMQLDGKGQRGYWEQIRKARRKNDWLRSLRLKTLGNSQRKQQAGSRDRSSTALPPDRRSDPEGLR